MTTAPHVTRKRLEQDSACGELTLKIEHGIRSYLHGPIPYEVLDDLVQEAWVRLLKLPEYNRNKAKAYNVGRRAAEKYYQRTKHENELRVDPIVDTENGPRNILEEIPDTETKNVSDCIVSVNLQDWVSSAGAYLLGADDWNWLLLFVNRRGFKPLADEERAKGMLSKLKPQLLSVGNSFV